MVLNPTIWHVLYVRHNNEQKVNNSLRLAKIESFLPTISTIRQWRDRKKKIHLPLFPSYIFVRITQNIQFYEALKISRVYKFLSCGKSYATVGEKEIISIKKLLIFDGVSKVCKKSDLPKIGAEMQIEKGPLAGIKCRVVKTGNSNRIFVDTSALDTSIMANIPLEYLSRKAV